MAPSFFSTPIARSTRSTLSASACASSVRFKYSRTTPMRSPASERAFVASRYGVRGVRPTLRAVYASFGS